MELRHLRYFVAVAEERSFTRAAERLHVAQPPLSRQIQQLEAELGASLIQRGTRPWSLTDAGQLVYEQALQTLEKFDAIPQVLKRFQEAKRSRIGIGFVASTLYGYLPEVIRSYRAARPDVDMNLLELTTFEQAAALKEGRIDVGFGRLPMQDPALRHQLLRNEPIVAAVPVGHRLAESDKPLRLSDLEGETVIVYPKHPRPSYADRVLSLIHAAGVKPLGFMEIKELQGALGLVAAGVGVCPVPASVQRLRRDKVVYRALDEPDATSPVIMSSRFDDKSPELKLILKLIKDIYIREGIPFGR